MALQLIYDFNGRSAFSLLHAAAYNTIECCSRVDSLSIRFTASPVDTATTSLDENGNPVESQRVEDDGNDNSGLCVQQQLQSVCVSDADTGRGLKRDDSNHCQPSMSNVAVDASSCETDDLKTERCHLDLDDDGGGSKDDIRTSTRFNLSRPGDASGVMRGKLPPAAVATGTVVRSRRKRSNRKKGRNQSHAAVDVEPLTSSVDDDVRGVTDVPNERCLQQLTSSVVVVVHDVNIDAFATVLDSLDAVGADATNNAENASSRTASERASDQLENRDSSSTHCVANSRPRSIDLNCRSVSSSNEQRTCGQIRRTSVDCLDKSSSCQRLTRADYSESQPDVLTNGRCSDFDASAASSSLSATDWQQRPQLATPGGKSTSDTATDVDCEAWRVAKSKNRPSRRHLGSSQPIDDRRIAAPTSADGRWSVMNASTAGVGRPKMNCKKQQVNPFNAEAARVFLHEGISRLFTWH
jgi:hypothetical protein